MSKGLIDCLRCLSLEENLGQGTLYEREMVLALLLLEKGEREKCDFS